MILGLCIVVQRLQLAIAAQCVRSFARTSRCLMRAVCASTYLTQIVTILRCGMRWLHVLREVAWAVLQPAAMDVSVRVQGQRVRMYRQGVLVDDDE